MKKGVVLALLAVLTFGATASAGTTASSIATGSVSVTCSLNQCGNFYGWTCDGAVDLDSVTVTMDVPTGKNGKARDAVYLGPGCTGRIGKVTISTNGGDGIKVAEGASNVAVGGGTVSCNGRINDVHQDGIQVMGGSRITFTGVAVACPTANNTQFFVNMAGSSTVPPDQILCVGCSFLPGGSYHDVTIGVSTNSGVISSTICPSALPQLTFDTTQATSPVNVNNGFPAAC